MATVFALACLMLLLNYRQNTHFERVLISGLSGVSLSLLAIVVLVFVLTHARRESLIVYMLNSIQNTHFKKVFVFRFIWCVPLLPGHRHICVCSPLCPAIPVQRLPDHAQALPSPLYTPGHPRKRTDGTGPALSLLHHRTGGVVRD